MRESTSLQEGKMYQIFGDKYIQNCVWVPWIVLTILLIAIRLEGIMRMIAWGSVCAIVSVNITYIIYCLIRYMIFKNKKGTPKT